MERLYGVPFIALLNVLMRLLLRGARFCDSAANTLRSSGFVPSRPVWLLWRLGHMLSVASLRTLKYRKRVLQSGRDSD